MNRLLITFQLVVSCLFANSQPIFEAIKNKNIQEVQKLAKRKKNLVAINPEYGTPLMTDTYFSDTSVVKLFIEKKVDVNQTLSKWWRLGYKHKDAPRRTKHHKLGNVTALDIAVKKNNATIAKLLVTNGATLNAKLLPIAVENNNFQLAKLLIDNGAISTMDGKAIGELIQETFSNQDTSLTEYIIAYRPNDECLLKAFTASAKSSKTDLLFWYAKHYFLDEPLIFHDTEELIIEVLKQGNLKVFHLLMKHGLSLPKEKSYSLLVAAAEKDDSILSANLIKYTDKQFFQNTDKDNLWRHLVETNKLNIIKFLHNQNILIPSIIAITFSDGSNALTLTSKLNYTKLTQQLVEFGSNLNTIDSSGYSALDYSIINKNDSLIEFLISQGALTSFNIDVRYSKGRRVVYHNGSHTCQKNKAVYYSFLDSTENHWTIEKYHTNGTLHMTGAYSDRNLTKADGVFTYYCADSSIYEKQYYYNNLLIRRETIKGTFPDTTVYILADTPPEFEGGSKALLKWISNNLKYPHVQCSLSGRVFVRFAIMWDGTIDKVKVERSVDPLLDKEAIRLVKRLPRFKPAFKNGIPISIWYTVPVNFQLQ